MAAFGSVVVRYARIEDVEAMALIMAAVAEEGLIGTEPPVDLDARARRLRAAIESDGPTASWVLDDGGRVVGNAGVHERAPGVLYLGMAILGESRGKGGGRAFLQAIAEHAQASRAHKLELEVWLDNARAIALYASAGFEVEGLRRAHYRRRDGSLRSALLMAQLLPDVSQSAAGMTAVASQLRNALRTTGRETPRLRLATGSRCGRG